MPIQKYLFDDDDGLGALERKWELQGQPEPPNLAERAVTHVLNLPTRTMNDISRFGEQTGLSTPAFTPNGQAVEERVANDEYARFLDKLAQSAPPSAPQAPEAAPRVPVAAPAHAAAPKPAPASLPGSGASAAAPADTSSLVKQAIAKKYGFGPTEDNQALSDAQDAARDGRFHANLGAGFNTLGHAIARATTPADNTFFKQLGDQAEQPVKDLIQRRQGAIQNEQLAKTQEADDPNSTLAYMLRKQLTPLAKQVGMDPSSFNNLSAAQLKDFGQQPVEFAIKMKELHEQAQARIQAAKQHQDYMQGSFELRKNLGERRLGLAEGTQAAKAATAFNSDPLIKVTTMQQGQIDKALGRLKDVESGKLPFTQATKSDIEKDIANILAGGSNSSLGAQERVEFSPYEAKWQNFMSKIKGTPQDLNLPDYVGQLKTMLGGLQDDIGGIQSRRSQFLQKSLTPAYSGNDRAMQAIQANVDLRQPSAPPPAGGPAVGTVEEHEGKKYRFKGGNPGDKNSWEML